VPPVLSQRVVPQCRVVIDNDFAGDPDGILALAHHLLSPSNRVVAITSSFLNSRFVAPPATPGATAADGTRLVAALLDELGLADPPPIATGAEAAGGGRSAAAEAIVSAAREEDDLPLYVVCGGPLTNVAAALELDPGIAGRLTLIWIGGSLDPDAFEYNRDTDPAAAAAVFAVPGLPSTNSRWRPTGGAPTPSPSWRPTSRRPAGWVRGCSTASRRRRSGCSSGACGRSATARRC
jgi:purine nucleosidase